MFWVHLSSNRDITHRRLSNVTEDITWPQVAKSNPKLIFHCKLCGEGYKSEFPVMIEQSATYTKSV